MKLFILLSFLLLLVFAPLHMAQAGFDGAYVGDQIEYRAAYEDTFVHLARDYKLGFVELRAANPNVDPWLPGEGTELILPTRHILPDAPREGVVINLPEMRLYAYVNGDAAPTTFPLGVGREGLETPVGETKIVRKKEGPTWTPTARMREEDPLLKQSYGPGPDNPLGTHALYLGWPTYAIHGTNRPFGIGRRISSGCIRMYPEDITRFYDMIPVGTKVTVVDQAVKAAWIEDKLYIEAHPSLEQSLEMEETAHISSPKISDADMEHIIKVAGEYSDRIRWAAVRTAIRERAGYPVDVARRPDLSVEESPVDEALSEEAIKAEHEGLEKVKEEAREALKDVYKDGDDTPDDSIEKAADAKPFILDFQPVSTSTLNP